MANRGNKVSPTLLCTIFFFVAALTILFVLDPIIPSSQMQAAAFVLAYDLTACPHVTQPGIATRLVDESAHLEGVLGISKKVLLRSSSGTQEFPCYDHKLLWKVADELAGPEKHYYLLGTTVAEYEWLMNRGAQVEMAETKDLIFKVPELKDPVLAEAATEFCSGKLTAVELYARLFSGAGQTKIPVLLDIHRNGQAP